MGYDVREPFLPDTAVDHVPKTFEPEDPQGDIKPDIKPDVKPKVDEVDMGKGRAPPPIHIDSDSSDSDIQYTSTSQKQARVLGNIDLTRPTPSEDMEDVVEEVLPGGAEDVGAIERRRKGTSVIDTEDEDEESRLAMSDLGLDDPAGPSDDDFINDETFTAPTTTDGSDNELDSAYPKDPENSIRDKAPATEASISKKCSSSTITAPKSKATGSSSVKATPTSTIASTIRGALKRASAVNLSGALKKAKGGKNLFLVLSSFSSCLSSFVVFPGSLIEALVASLLKLLVAYQFSGMRCFIVQYANPVHFERVLQVSCKAKSAKAKVKQ